MAFAFLHVPGVMFSSSLFFASGPCFFKQLSLPFVLDYLDFDDRLRNDSSVIQCQAQIVLQQLAANLDGREIFVGN